MGAECPLCGREIKKRRKPFTLYGHQVCKKCYYGLANRRQLAFLVDWIGWQFVAGGLGAAVAFMIIVTGGTEETLDTVTSLLGWGLVPIFFCKDGLSGYSPGKLLMGVRVIDEETGKPISPVASLKRNLPLVIPFVPLIIAFTLAKGERIGDGWANTMVVWKKYADSPVFSTGWIVNPKLEMASETIPEYDLIDEDGNPYRAPIM